MTEIPVDLNNVRTDGRIRVNLKRANGPVDVGDLVTVVDAPEDLRFPARVLEIESATGRAWLRLMDGFTLAADAWRSSLRENTCTGSGGLS